MIIKKKYIGLVFKAAFAAFVSRELATVVLMNVLAMATSNGPKEIHRSL